MGKINNFNQRKGKEICLGLISQAETAFGPHFKLESVAEIFHSPILVSEIRPKCEMRPKCGLSVTDESEVDLCLPRSFTAQKQMQTGTVRADFSGTMHPPEWNVNAALSYLE